MTNWKAALCTVGVILTFIGVLFLAIRFAYLALPLIWFIAFCMIIFGIYTLIKEIIEDKDVY